MNEHNQDLNRTQLDNEARAINRAAKLKKDELERQINNEQEFNLTYGNEAILAIMPIPEKELTEMFSRKNQHTKKFYWKYIKPIQDLEREVKPKVSIEYFIASIVALELTASLSSDVTLTSIASDITNVVFHNLRVPMEERREMSKHGIGFFAGLVMDIAENTDIFTIEQVNGRENRLFLSPEWEEHVRRCKDEYNTNVCGFDPMVVMPNVYSNLLDSEAGYLLTPSPLLKFPTRDLDKKVLESITNFNDQTNPAFFAYVNRVAQTPYCVNARLLEKLQDFYNKRKMFFADFPRMVESEEERGIRKEAALKGANKEILARNAKRKSYADWKGLEYTPLTADSEALIIKEHEKRYEDKVSKTTGLLKKAYEFVVFDNLYYPPFLDARGRIYPYASGSLSTQGDEMAKALIQFANKKVLGKDGMNALFDTLGNTLGFDKMLLPVKRQKAIAWFKKHYSEFNEGNFDLFILDSHKPEKERELEEPITAMAICIELMEASKDPEYKSGYVNHRDARVSGSSILGTSMLDKNLMEMTSVIDWYNEENRLGDAYVAAAEAAMKVAKGMAEGGDEIAIDLYTYHEELFNRKVFKHVVMTWCSYGLTDFSLREYNKGVFDWDEELSSEHKWLFDNIMLKALKVAMPSCAQFLMVFKKVGAEVAKRDGMVSYTNPLSGFPVAFTASKVKKQRLEVDRCYRVVKLNLMVPTGKPDNMAIANAMAPNVVHSIDAALLFRVSHVCDFDLCFIHDSIGSHPADTDKAVAAYASAMYKLAKSNVLNNILEQLDVDQRLTSVGTATDEDIESIKNSKHILV
ncbi:MAG: DNA-directed RNA polymerase [Fusobacteriaceae bacterium]